MMVPLVLGRGLLGSLAREFALWVGIFLLLASVLSFYRGWNQRQLATVVTETPRSDIAAVRSPGIVRIRGKIEPQATSDTFLSPVKGDENCVLAAWEIQEQYDRSNTWEKAAWGVNAVPFYLSDGTEKILVDIDDEVVGNKTSDVFSPETFLSSEGVSIEGLWCEFEAFDVHVETGSEESPPRRLATFLENTDGISVDPMVTDLGDRLVDASERKYLEQALQPGDRISIIGYATPRRRGMASAVHPRDLVLTQAAEATLHLSEHPFDELADGSGTLLFGTLTGLVGIGLLAMRFGL